MSEEIQSISGSAGDDTAAKLLFMSGAGTTGPADQAPAGSVTLPKPFTREDLLLAVRDLIGSAAP